MPLRRVPDFLTSLRNLHGALAQHHGNYRGTFLATLMEAQGAALIGSDGEVFDHRMSLQGFANSLNNNLTRVDRILEEVRTRDTQAGSLLTHGVGPFTGLARSRYELARQTDDLAADLARNPAEADRLGGIPAAPRGRGRGGTVAQQIENLRIRTGWTPAAGNDVLPPLRMADPANQLVLQQIGALPVNGATATDEAAEAARRARQLIASFVTRYRGDSAVFSGYAAALERLWTPHGRIND